MGGLNINPSRLRFDDSDTYNASHKFVVEALDTAVSIYVAEVEKHMHVAGRFNIPNKRLVGGGSCYLNGEEQLVLNDYSGGYRAIPKEAAQRFAELIVPKLRKLGVEIKGIAVDPSEWNLHSFWREKGFGSK